MTPAERTARHYRKALTEFIAIVEASLKAFDKTMTEPQTLERGKKLALIMNNIELQKDIAKRYGLNPPKFAALSERKGSI